MSYLVKLDTFEGPLDLLLFLIRKEEMDIQKIEISKITAQYLEFINTMKALDVDLASEFIVMAATLIYIKSKMLLPKTEEEAQEEGQDPREELIRRLMEYQQFKQAAEELDKKPILNEDLFKVRLSSDQIDHTFDPKEGLIEVGVYELAVAFQELLSKVQKTVHTVDTEEYSLEDKIVEIIQYLSQNQNQLVDFKFLFSNAPTRQEIVATFLAILELTKLGYIKLFQNGFEQAIYVKTIREFGDMTLTHEELLKTIFPEVAHDKQSSVDH